MALATQCPHCHTTFRVAHDQLKLRAGLVRCGACKQIFNGIENLLRPEELERAGKPVPSAPPAHPDQEPPAAAETTPRPIAPTVDVESVQEPKPGMEEPALAETPDSSVATEAAIPESIEEKKADPLLRMTLMDIAPERQSADAGLARSPLPSASEADDADALEQTIDDLQNKPWRSKPEAAEEPEGDALDQAEAADYEEPAFVRQARRRQRIGRALRIIMGAGSIVLFIGLIAQGAYVFRDRIAARFPETRPVLVEACAYIDCQVGLPAQIESVSIESSELQTLAASDNTFALTVLLRNHGATEQAWPHFELTLNDTMEKPIARRVFAPRDYLPPTQDFSRGFAANSEQAIKLFFELSQLKASGYRVYLFYP